MTKRKNHIFVLNKRSFTLVELLISIVILVIIFTFLYGQFNLAYLSTEKTTKVEQESTKKEMFLKLFYKDFIEASKVTPTSISKKYDALELETNNSLYGISKAFVKWNVVEKDDNIMLVRIESHKPIVVKNRENEFYMETILENLEYFKVVKTQKYLEFFIQTKEIKNIHFKLQGII